MSPAEIARTIGVHRSTVSREVKRNSDGRGHHKYNHDLAQRKADKARRWSHTRHCTNGYGTRRGMATRSWRRASETRGANENTNGLIRQYIPKGTDFSTLTDEFIAEVE